jgi:hypothetical protein
VPVASRIPARNPPKCDEQLSAGLHCIHAFAGLDYDLLDKINVFTNVQDVQDDA